MALLTPGGHGIWEGNLPKCWGSGGLESTDGLARQGFPFTGLGMGDVGSDGLVMACSLWGCADGPGKQVKVDWPHMFSCSVVLFALCLNDIAPRCKCLLNDGPRDGTGGVLVGLKLHVPC